MSEDMLQVSRVLVAFILFTLVLIRIGSLVLFAPFFGSEVFSARVRLYFVAALSVLLIQPAADTAEIPVHLEMSTLAILAMQEFAVGTVIAFLAGFVFTGVQLAGEMAGQQIGFSMANVVDPMTGIQMPILGNINTNLTIMLFLVAKLHLALIYILAKSYDFVGIGGLVAEVAAPPLYAASRLQAEAIFTVGLRLAIPIMLVMLMNSVVEGFVTKTMPQMNIMVLGMPLRVVLGLSALIFVYPAICVALVPPDWRFNLVKMPAGALGDMLNDLGELVEAMGGWEKGP
ncbi:MAG: flagellar biosynthetic protein FliR [Planctomycetota bacterium]|jgi:flagellar biosynthetic protein FliR|nr:flagellar biosynthetic protein FliR [Planctomycetota bacterium]